MNNNHNSKIDKCSDPAIQSEAVVPIYVDWGGGRLINATRNKVRWLDMHPVEIDARELLAHPQSAVVLEFLRVKLPKVSIDPTNLDLCDERVKQACQLLGGDKAPLQYAEDPPDLDFWQMPAETIARTYGDCEDLAITLASFLLCLGVSPHRYRVALGWLMKPNETCFSQHAWVMYRSDDGDWWLLEATRGTYARLIDHPPLRTGEPLKLMLETPNSLESKLANAYSYIPILCFNREHMWQIAEDNEVTVCTNQFNSVLRVEYQTYTAQFLQGWIVRPRALLGYPFTN